MTSTGATSALRTQIEQGSPADVLLGADTTNAQALIDEGDAIGPLTRCATNVLTVIVPANNPKGIQSPADLAKPGVCVIGAGADVPITKYATQLVANLCTATRIRRRFRRQVRGERVLAGGQRRRGRQQGQPGRGRRGDRLRDGREVGSEPRDTFAVPADSNVLATYGGAAVKASPNAARLPIS